MFRAQRESPKMSENKKSDSNHVRFLFSDAHYKASPLELWRCFELSSIEVSAAFSTFNLLKELNQLGRQILPEVKSSQSVPKWLIANPRPAAVQLWQVKQKTQVLGA